MRETAASRNESARDGNSISEMDILWLTAGLGCDGDTIAMTGIQAVRPNMQVFQLSSKTGQGMEACFEFLSARASEGRGATAIGRHFHGLCDVARATGS